MKRVRIGLMQIVSLIGIRKAEAAGGSGVLSPVTEVFRKMQLDLSGETGFVIITVLLIAAGLIWAFSEHGHGIRKVIGVFIGAAIVFGAVRIMTSFGWSGALL